ncbi:hypothetical protein V1514DRAFT_326870 [Lipomyces japonicus]|uniref:uncharacterized protein n=1 Tax=Lipomyces japonicus TaxID=56871 RepID=UPI0034CEF329
MAGQLFEFVAIIPDKTDDGAVDRRLAVREAHLANVKKLFAEKVITSGGAFLDDPIVQGVRPTFKGSIVSFSAESKEAVEAILKQDPYAENDVWDFSKVQIYNFAVAVRQAKE